MNPVDLTFSHQDPDMLEQLAIFEKQEELLLQIMLLIQHTQGEGQAFQAEEEHPEEEDGGKEYYDCAENPSELDRVVPDGIKLEHWRDLLDLEEYEDAPENVQELLEAALGEQRRLPVVN